MPATRYVLIPRLPSDALLGAPAPRRLGSVDSRRSRSRELAEARASLPAVKELGRWLDERRDAVRRGQLDAGGAVVFDGTRDELRDLDGLDVQIIEDRPMDPIRSILSGAPLPGAGSPWHLDRLGLVAARQAGAVGLGADVTVAVLDSGVDRDHPDLAGRVDEALVRVDGAFARVAGGDDNGHGTSIAGLVAGAHTGIAPAARVLPMQTTQAQRMTLAHLLRDWLPWLLQNPVVDVVNLSLGVKRSEFSAAEVAAVDALFNQLLDLDVLPVAAIGNFGPDVACVPAQLDSVLSVGATNAGDRVWSASGSVSASALGPAGPNVVAPGVLVSSTATGGGYRTWSGSSHATAVVSGLAAVLLERDRALTARELRGALLEGATALAGSPGRQGRGIVSL